MYRVVQNWIVLFTFCEAIIIIGVGKYAGFLKSLSLRGVCAQHLKLSGYKNVDFVTLDLIFRAYIVGLHHMTLFDQKWLNQSDTIKVQSSKKKNMCCAHVTVG